MPFVTTRFSRKWMCGALMLGFWVQLGTTVQAQSGSFLESLFRSIAEKKMQESRSRQPVPTDPRQADSRQADPRQSGFPGGPKGFPGGPLGPAAPSQVRPAPARPTNPAPPTMQRRHSPDRPGLEVPGGNIGRKTIRTNSPDVRDLAQQLVRFDGQLTPLMGTLQAQSRTNREVRTLLPELYQVQAQTRALLDRCDGAASLTGLVSPYSALDQRWRELSFRLRALPNRTDQLRDQVVQCDSVCRNLARRCGVTPQFDRHGLHDQMVIAATYIQALLDDLPTARIPTDRSRDLVRQGRLLREAILEAADHVDHVDYDEIVTQFTDFVARWRGYGETIAAINDPVLDRRLARISGCGDETYALLWMPPPSRYDNGVVPGGSSLTAGGRYSEQLVADAAALEGASEYYVADLQRLLRYLTPASYRDSVGRESLELHQLAKQLHAELDSGQPLDRLQRTTSRLAQVWESLSKEIGHIDAHGLTGRRVLSISQQHQQMLPLVASLSASLLPMN